MGCLVDKPNERKLTSPSDVTTKEKDEAEEKSFKLLLLGAGGSGKSTVFRQVKILYGNGYNNDERSFLSVNIHRNMIVSIKRIVEQCSDQGCNIPDENKDLVEEILKLNEDGPYETETIEKIGKLINSVWKLPAVKNCYKV